MRYRTALIIGFGFCAFALASEWATSLAVSHYIQGSQEIPLVLRVAQTLAVYLWVASGPLVVLLLCIAFFRAQRKRHREMSDEQTPGSWQCAGCQRTLTRLEKFTAMPAIGGTLPALYGGVICSRCGRVECSDCKGVPVDAPCSWCAGPVSPAFEHMLKQPAGLR
jgi:hypothetical protein